MRTLVDLPDDLLLRLGRAAEREGTSRAELVRRAVALYLRQLPDPDAGGAFGMWRSRKLDALAYEDRVRSEWQRRERGRPHKHPR